MSRVFLVCSLSLGLTILQAGFGMAATPSVTGPLAHELNDSFAGVFEKASPSVVVIESKVAVARPIPGLPRGLEFFLRGQDGSVDSQPTIGSGFILREDGYILTNSHVVENAESIIVRLRDGRRFEAELVGIDDATDLAVLKVMATGLPAAELADSNSVKVGQFAFAIGAPMELPYTFTVGVISAKDRSLGRSYGDLIQTDASINPGNSGGPLCDIDGKVVGVNTLISGMNRGLGFAIPINLAAGVARQIIDTGYVKRPWLGISIAGIAESVELQHVFPGLEKGVVVERIEPGAPAESSDLRAGDVIVKVDGVEVSQAVDLQRQIRSKAIGQLVSLDVWRGGRILPVQIHTGEQPNYQRAALRQRPSVLPHPQQAPAHQPPLAAPSSPGMTYRDATAEALHAMGLKRNEAGGVLVTEVEDGSAAAGAGIRPGDVITEAAGKKVLRSADLEQALADDAAGDGTLLIIDRSGERAFAIFKPQAAPDRSRP